MESMTSVIIPSYNSGRYLEEALISVRDQTVSAKEIIIIDDGSDEPVQLPASWTGANIMLIRTANKGQAAARNLGATLSTGKYLAFLDADDRWLPSKIENQQRRLEEESASVACFVQCTREPDCFEFGPYPPDSRFSQHEFALVLWYNNFFPPSATMVRRSAFLEVGGFNEYIVPSEDIELWFRLLKVGPFTQVPQALCRYRRHQGQSTANTLRKMNASKKARKSIIENCRDVLEKSGIRIDRAWDAYRNDILLIYFRREMSTARRLLWNYWINNINDLLILKYAAASLLPCSIFIIMERMFNRKISSNANSEIATNNSWEYALRGAADAVNRMRI